MRAALAALAALTALIVFAPAAGAGGSGNQVYSFRVTQIDYEVVERLRVNEVEEFRTLTSNVERRTTIRRPGGRGDAAHFVFERRPVAGAPVGTLSTRAVTATTTQTGSWTEVTRDGERSGGTCDGRTRYGPGVFGLTLIRRGARVSDEMRPFNVQGPDRRCKGGEPGLDTEIEAKISLAVSRFRNRTVVIPFSAGKTTSSPERTESITWRGSFTLQRVLRCPPSPYPACNRFQ